MPDVKKNTLLNGYQGYHVGISHLFAHTTN